MQQYRASHGALAAWRQGASPSTAQTARLDRHFSIRVRGRNGARLGLNIATTPTITPSKGGALFTGRAPTVTQSAAQMVAPSKGSAVFTGRVPTISQSNATNVAPSKGALTLTGRVPLITQAGNITVAPFKGAAVLSGKVPVVVSAGHTLVEDMQAVLAPLATGGSWYQVNEQQPATLPYIVFSRVTSPANVTMQGPSVLQNTHVQIDIYSRNAGELVNLGNQLEAALLAAPFINIQLSSRDLYEAETKLRRTCYEYSVWSSN